MGWLKCRISQLRLAYAGTDVLVFVSRNLSSLYLSMARMYTRRRGKSGSKKPVSDTSPVWINHKPSEVELLVVKLAKQGLSPSMTGLVLRDSYGIPDVELVTKKKVGRILAEKGLSPKVPQDLQNLIKRAIGIKKHLEVHKKDKVSKRGLQLTEAKIDKLARYYKRRGVLLGDWKFDIEKAGLLVGE